MSINEKLGQELSERAKEMVETHERWSKIIDPSANGEVEIVDDVFMRAGSWHAEVMFRESDRPLIVVFPERAPLDHKDGYITSSRLADNRRNWATFHGLIYRVVPRPNGLSLRKFMFGHYGTSDDVSIFNCTEEPKDASHILLGFELDSIVHRVDFVEIPAGLGGAVAYGKFFTDTGKKDLYFYMVLDIRKLPDIMTKTEPDDSSYLWVKIADIVDFAPSDYQQFFEKIQYNENYKYLLTKEETSQARWRQKCEFRKFRHNRAMFIDKAHQFFPDSCHLIHFHRDYFTVDPTSRRYPYDPVLFVSSKNTVYPFYACITYQMNNDSQAESAWFHKVAQELMNSAEFHSFLESHGCVTISTSVKISEFSLAEIKLSLEGFKTILGVSTDHSVTMDHYSREAAKTALIEWLTSLKAKFDQLDHTYAKLTDLYFARLAQTPHP